MSDVVESDLIEIGLGEPDHSTADGEDALLVE
jgi:hypothetical protein